MDRSLSITYSPTRQDYFQTIFRHNLSAWSTRIGLGVMAVLALAFVVLAVDAGINGRFIQILDYWGVVILLLVFPLAILGGPWLVARRTVAHMERTGSTEIHLSIEDGMVHLQRGAATSDFPVGNLAKILFHPSHVLMFTQPNGFMPIPKRFLTKRDLSVFYLIAEELKVR